MAVRDEGRLVPYAAADCGVRNQRPELLPGKDAWRPESAW